MTAEPARNAELNTIDADQKIKQITIRVAETRNILSANTFISDGKQRRQIFISVPATVATYQGGSQRHHRGAHAYLPRVDWPFFRATGTK